MTRRERSQRRGRKKRKGREGETKREGKKRRKGMPRGLEKHVLDGVNARPLVGSGCGSFCRGPLNWIRGWGLPMGSIPAAAHW